jgi:hypothetical protein
LIQLGDLDLRDQPEADPGRQRTQNSRSEAQLLVVKIRRGGRSTCKKGTPQSKINLSFFTNAFETLGTRWRAGRLEVTGSDTRTSCGMCSYKRQTRTLASSGRTVRRIPGSHPPPRLSERRRAADQGKAKQASILPLWALIPSLSPRLDVVLASNSVLQDPDAITGSSLLRKACTQLTHGSLRGSFTPLTSNPLYANRGRAKSRRHNTARGGRYPSPAFFRGCFGLRSAPPHTSES